VVADLSATVRGQSPDALWETASDYVRQNPALVLSTAVACGFALARLLQGVHGMGAGPTYGRETPGTMSQSNAT